MENQMEVSLKEYGQFLAEVQNCMASSVEILARQKVQTAWQIGRLIADHLGQNTQKDYSKEFFTRLESDVKITKSVLYKMHSFYKTYPELPGQDAKLNWSHYRILSGIKEERRRQYLEDLTRDNDWSSHELRDKVKKTKIFEISEKAKENRENHVPKLIRPKRGKLFCYALVENEKLGQTQIDLGFKIFRSFEGLKNSSNKIIQTAKRDKNYTFRETSLEARQINVYKGYVTRIVDGDTIRVLLDLGFETYHEEILRLRGINAPEMKSEAGQSSARALKRILDDLPFVIIKTTAKDVYGRYVADVFLSDAKNEFPAQEVADEGIYLNQLLLDQDLAKPY